MYQFGFREGHSTEQAILEVTDALKKDIDKTLVTCRVFPDFSKVFDTTNHEILLSKLYHCGIPEILLDGLITTYTIRRTQFAAIGDTKSGYETWFLYYFCSIQSTLRLRTLVSGQLCLWTLFSIPLCSSFMRAHAQAMNEYREGVMSTEVVDRRQKFVDRNCGPYTEVKLSSPPLPGSA